MPNPTLAALIVGQDASGATVDAANLYWERSQLVWNNTGDTAMLRDASGTKVARFAYP